MRDRESGTPVQRTPPTSYYLPGFLPVPGAPYMGGTRYGEGAGLSVALPIIRRNMSYFLGISPPPHEV